MFRDRREAGRVLAARLDFLRTEDPVVVGLPRGGVPVAAEVARELGAPLDVLVVRKLGCPWQPELGMGAVGEGGIIVLNEDLVARFGLSRDDVETVARAERQELERRVRRYRGDRAATSLEGRTVIVVDDGIATGFTVRAAVAIARRRGARRVVLATPVAPSRTVEELARVADDVVTMEEPEEFLAIGQFYEDFTQTSDEEVAAYLAGSMLPLVEAVGTADPPDPVEIDLSEVRLAGDLTLPADPVGVIVFAHGSGSSRLSPRNRFVARALNEGRLATLLFDLLTTAEEIDRANVFDIELLAGRLVEATRWLQTRRDVRGLPIGYFGASTGAAAALWAAANLGAAIAAVVSRGGRPDLARETLHQVRAPTLLIVGGRDEAVLALNRQAQAALQCANALEVVPGATHLFEEPGALDRVAQLARNWFVRFLRGAIREAG
ncbi:MAG: phosphoribosyltransferase family protein [Actinomycetota bacterium]